MPELPDDPTSFEGLARAGMVVAPRGWAAYQRDSLSAEDRDAWDARVEALHGQIVTKQMESQGLRPGRMMPRTQLISYYLVPDPERAP